MIRPLKVRGEVKNVESPNTIYDDRVIKYTINIPCADYERITKLCKERRIHRSVWFREAIGKAFNTDYTSKELIDYEIMRRLGEIKSGELPEKVKTSSARTSDPVFNRKYPGFISGLLNNSFRLNHFRREATE